MCYGKVDRERREERERRKRREAKEEEEEEEAGRKTEKYAERVVCLRLCL